jgi:glycosyltransferase involved in cell wall biosynthesis
LVALTPDDAAGFKSLGFNKPILIAPIGVDVASYKTVDLQTKPVQFFHLGSMDWLPNEEAVSWLIQNVLPLLTKKGNVNISLAGKGMPQWIFNLSNPSLQIKGLVSDAKNYMSKRHVMLVPILSGSGMRVKILEGLATGNVIISTTIGAEGIKYTHMLNMIIADTPKQFADAMCLLLDNPLLIEKISIEAKKLAWQHYDNEGIGKSMIAFYSKLK